MKFGAQLGVIVVLGCGLAGCETMASLDPTGLLADESTPAVDPNSAAASPELANIPAAPPVSDDQRNVADSLAAQGAQAQYSADALRAGTEASAPAPVAAGPISPQAAAALAAADAPPSASDAPPSAAPAAESAPSAPPSAGPPIPVSGNAVAAASLPPATPAPEAAAAPAPVRTASAAPAAPQTPAAPPPGAEPAVPAVPPAGAIRSTIMAPPVMSDAALGFKPSTAPALDPSIGDFVSAPILARYKQTASAGSGGRPAATVGGDGVIVAASPSALNGPAPTAVVYFPGDGTTVSAAARAQIRRAVAAFKNGGGTGTVRVVGHASSRTANMSVEKHLEVIFEKSQKRASAVAEELIRQGVPADHVQIDAVGDSQPVYYESMPKGEEGNRRAEIFVES